MDAVNVILWAMTSMASFGVALFFLRFWKQTEDRLFAFFALAFSLLGVNWIVLAATRPAAEGEHLVYLVRLAAFLVIILAILDKNRRPT